MNGSTVCARLVKAGGVSRFAIANPEVAPYGRAAEAVLRKRGLWDALRPNLVLGDTIAQAAQFATTGNAVGGLIAYSLVLEPGLRRPRHLCRDSRRRYPPLRQRMVLLKRAGAVAAQFYAYLQRRRRARDSPETRLRGARIAVHGLDGSPCLAVARRGHDRDPAPVRHLVRAAAGGPPLPRQAARRGAGHGAARVAAHGARVLSARHLRRPLAAGRGLPGARRASRCRSPSRACCSHPPSRTFRSSSSRSSAASKRSRPTCATPPRAAA